MSFINSFVPTGALFHFAATTAPYGYLFCNGAIISKTTYANLWAFAQSSGNLSPNNTDWLNNNFGKFCDYDANNFRVPLIQDDFLRATGTRTIGTWQDSDNKSHSHGVTDSGHIHGITDSGHAHNVPNTVVGTGSQFWDGSGPLTSGNTISDLTNTGISINSNTTGITINNSGDSEARPRNIAYPVCIKY